MRKMLGTALAFGFLALALGSSARSAGFAVCRYKCDCAGTPLRCCVFNGVESCQPTDDIACTQVYNC